MSINEIVAIVIEQDLTEIFLRPQSFEIYLCMYCNFFFFFINECNFHIVRPTQFFFRQSCLWCWQPFRLVVALIRKPYLWRRDSLCARYRWARRESADLGVHSLCPYCKISIKCNVLDILCVLLIVTPSKKLWPRLPNFASILFQPTSVINLITKELMSSGRNPIALQSACEAALQLGKVPMALDLFTNMKQLGMPIRPHYFWPILLHNAKFFGEKGLWDSFCLLICGLNLCPTLRWYFTISS